MSWAMRRRVLYVIGVTLFFAVVFGVPLTYKLLSVPPSCTDGQMNQNETSVDRGGPCPLVDTSKLSPASVMWARSFQIRSGAYSAVSYIQNPNDEAGVDRIAYVFSLYDSQNILVAERRGETFIMPGGITPVFEPDIDSGTRVVTRTFFKFDSAATWKHFADLSKAIRVSDRTLTNETSVPRLEAKALNTEVSARKDVTFVAVLFDTAGNAFASSATHIDKLNPAETVPIVFTWPEPFSLQVGRIDILPVVSPKAAWTQE